MSTENFNINENTDNTQQENLSVVIKSREEILQKRKERKEQQRELKKINRDRVKYEEKVNKKSEKIQIIPMERFEKCQATLNTTDQNLSSSHTPRRHTLRGKFHKIQKDFNLLDFLVEKKVEKKSLVKRLKVDKSLTTIKLNRGKKREIPKKKDSRLRKIILKNRILRKQNTLNVNSQTDELKIKSEEEENCEPIDLKEQLILEKCDEKEDIEENLIPQLEKLEITHENELNMIKPKILHSRKFQSYCDNTISKNLCSLVENLLRDLFRFQKRAYEKNQIKARAHKRYVVGFKEVERQLDIRKTKLIILAPDCEKCDLPGGILDIINGIKLKCKNENIPYLFALNRRKLGYLLFKKVPVSCIGILNYDGAQNIFHSLIECISEERKNYEKLIKGEEINNSNM